VLRYHQVLQPSGHSTFRILVHEESRVPEVCRLLEGLGCDTERSHLPRLVAIDIPPDVPLASVREALAPGVSQERWAYEEACLGQPEVG
jgi:hypothetical protein